MMKRLHFLRNSLDAHNAAETTRRMRENADRKKDERIQQLWYRDKNNPNVEDVVNNMRTEA